jgi:hypothetical protein
MFPEESDRLQRIVLLHLLEHRGQQVRFEASHWTTEIGILRRFENENPVDLKAAIRSLEMSRMIYRRIQYVVGYSEPKEVFFLSPSGHRKAVEYQREIEERGGAMTPEDPRTRVESAHEAWDSRAPEPSV